MIFGQFESDNARLFDMMSFWEQGMWNNALLVFAFQMMLMLVLGHVLAISTPVNKLIQFFVKYCTDTARAALLVSLFTILVGFVNWGLGLIFGAIFARKVGEHALHSKKDLNYALIGAAGYAALVVWHGGLSGSSLTKVAEPGHLQTMMSGMLNNTHMEMLPDQLTFTSTVFSNMNLFTSFFLVIMIPLVLYLVGKKDTGSQVQLNTIKSEPESESKQLEGAERLDYSFWLSKLVGTGILIYAVLKVTESNNASSLGFITPNYINLVLFGLGLLLHRHVKSFVAAVESAIGGAAGILIQFPLYFGIMGMMKEAGLIDMLSNYFISISTDRSFPIFTLISAGLVNIFVPSGGGQWAVQGPIIVKAALSMDIPLSKSILALAYGDQLTNMLQPFWALPLLGITGLKAKQILPYTLVIFAVAAVIFTIALLIY